MRVAVIGAGRMGSGIAQVFLSAGAHVAVRDPLIDPAPAIGRGLRTAESKGGGSADEALGRLTVGAVPYDSDLVVEAVPEDPGLKASVLAEVEEQVHEGAVLATNTSSLSITELSAALKRPERFLGMHFFNPVPVQRLVELVVTPATQVLEQVRGYVGLLGKTAVVVNDSPGFATSRLGVLLGLEAIRMVEEGVASPDDIDTAMTLGYGYPMGPLRLGDLVGLDVRLAIADYLHGRLGARFEPPELLRRMVARGELGRKTGRGFYQW
ncbi:MAG: 3-hydroxyacyl-CoA dehydrogenase family protein [Thermoactinospora sp.]|nr:3-hydroxyacyl-CoA dehydrogenase family protein [Thermoactinospora sp.]